MPQAASFTVEDGAATPVDTLFTLLTPAAGKSAAVWVAKSKGPTVATQPKVDVSTTGTKVGRALRLSFRLPYWVTGTDGRVTVVDSQFASLSMTVPDTIPDANRADFVALFANIIATALVKEMLKDGHSAV